MLFRWHLFSSLQDTLPCETYQSTNSHFGFVCGCYLGLTYHGKLSDTWAVGVTLYCMILGEYPFLGDTLQDTYDRVRFILTSHPLILLHKLNVTYFQPILKKSKLDVFLLFQIVNNPIEIPDDINPQLKNLIEGLLCKGTWHSTSVSSY